MRSSITPPRASRTMVHDVDLVFDTVGGDTLQRSWQVIKPGGALVSIVGPPPAAEVTQGHDVRFVWFVVYTQPRSNWSRLVN